MKETSPKKPDRSYAILGTGALGGVYGGCLQRAGLDVHFLVNSDYQQVCQSGLVVESVEGDFTLNPVKAYQDVRQMPPCDVVVVTLKTTNNYLLPQFLPPVLKDYEGGKPLEVEAIFGNPLGAATSAGADLPRITMLLMTKA